MALDDHVETCDLGRFAGWAVGPSLTPDVEEGLRSAG